jgi:antitoxin ParD1/3/4
MAQMVRQQVESGSYASSSEVIRDALRLWQERAQERDRRLHSIRGALAEAAADPVRYTGAEVSDHFDQLLEETAKKSKR